VKLGNNANDTCAMLSDACGGEDMKKLTGFDWYKRFEGSSHVEISNDDITHHFVRYQFISRGQTVNQAYYVEILKRLRKLCLEKGLNFGPTIEFSTMKMLQLTRRSLLSSSWPKLPLLKWSTHPVPLILLRMSCGCFQK
jgi:hypothetical protein